MTKFIFEHNPDQSPDTVRNAPPSCADTVKLIKACEDEDVVTISLHKSNLKTDAYVDSFIRANPSQAIDLINGTECGSLIDRKGKPFNVHSHIAAVALDWYTNDSNYSYSQRVGEVLHRNKTVCGP